ncbi:MAG: transcriptional regulator, partial [Salinibacterium sp.]|nr:transcriptional regulator [Salinibacterium sp.]
VEVGLIYPVPVGREIRYRALGSRLDELAGALSRIGDDWERRLGTIKRIAERL